MINGIGNVSSLPGRSSHKAAGMESEEIVGKEISASVNSAEPVTP